MGVVAGGDEELPSGVDADAGQGDQVGGYGRDQAGQVAVEIVDLGLEREPAAGEAAQSGLGGGRRIGDRAGPQGRARADTALAGQPAQELPDGVRCRDDEGLYLASGLDAAFIAPRRATRKARIIST